MLIRRKHEKNLDNFMLKLYNNIKEDDFMTLKELRISKGLTQVECANYMQMTVRNYQNYEKNINKINTVRYNDIYKKIELYGTYNVLQDINFEYNSFNTNVIIGEGLKSLHNVVKGYKKKRLF